MNGLRIACLSEVPECIPALASAHVAAFGELLPDWTVTQAAAELSAHGRDELPVTWVVLSNSEHAREVGLAAESAPQCSPARSPDWLGSVSLLHQDHADMPQFSPWLASLYVRPQARGRGIATALLAHAIVAARRLAVPRLYLYCTLPLLGFYSKSGWQLYARLPLGPLQVAVMAIDTGTRRYD